MKETHWHHFIAQIVHREAKSGTVIDPLGTSTMPELETIGIKWRWHDDMYGFWGVVRDREDALINVATTFYKYIRRQKRQDHWWWRVFYRAVDHVHRLDAEALGKIWIAANEPLPEEAEIPPQF